MEAHCAFSLSQASIKPEGTHHMANCLGQLSRAVLLIEVAWQEGQNYVLDSERSFAPLAEWR